MVDLDVKRESYASGSSSSLKITSRADMRALEAVREGDHLRRGATPQDSGPAGNGELISYLA